MVDGAVRKHSIDLATAVARASGQLAANPSAAKALALQILQLSPSHPQARLILGSALRRLGEAEAAKGVLSRLALEHRDWSVTHYELGMALSALGQKEGASNAFREATSMTPSPDMAPAWRALGDREMAEATEALASKAFEAAQSLLTRRLEAGPQDVPAMRLLAELKTLRGSYNEAEALLTRCLSIEPDAPGLRHSLAMALLKQFKPAAALVHIDALLEATPSSPQYLTLRAVALTNLGESDQAISLYERLLAKASGVASLWLSYGDALKISGRSEDCIAAYKRAVQLAPSFGKAYWSLANLKTVPFASAEVAAMQAALNQPRLSNDDRLHLHYALGKALEDRADFAQSFIHYDQGAKLWRAQTAYDAEQTSELVERCRSFFTKAFFEARRGQGHQADDPIFVIGLPRSGSTLVEQILSSHPAVEGTMELADLGMIAALLGPGDGLGERTGYPEGLGSVDGDRLAAFGRDYIASTAVQRKTAKPYFVDKMPYNFFLIGLIQLILPNAKIIDVRRHPMACCLSLFKQHFPIGNRFSYDLRDAGRYYRDYVSLMAHYDSVLPDRVYRVRYESLVENLDGEVRKLLDYCRLPFEQSCLRFYENDRGVRTASSEQVRRPIFREGVDHWRRFEPWLGPLKAALGPALHDD